MRAFLRRQFWLLSLVATGFVVGCLIGLARGLDASGVTELALQIAGVVGGLLLLWRFLLILVTTDPEKPRSVTRQNRSASGYGGGPLRRS